MNHSAVTMSDQTIHNPAEPRHFLRAKPVARLVRVHRAGEMIAETRRATRVTEISRDMLDPIFYLPKPDILVPLTLVEGQTTHCPLKGDASYFSVPSGDTIAWSYETPFDFVAILKGLVAFYPDEVTVEEIGKNA